MLSLMEDCLFAHTPQARIEPEYSRESLQSRMLRMMGIDLGAVDLDSPPEGWTKSTFRHARIVCKHLGEHYAVIYGCNDFIESNRPGYFLDIIQRGTDDPATTIEEYTSTPSIQAEIFR